MNTSTTASDKDSVAVLPPPKNERKKKLAKDTFSSKDKSEKKKTKNDKTRERRFTLHMSDYALMDHLKATLKESNRMVKKVIL
jgi:hypothetical protein